VEDRLKDEIMEEERSSSGSSSNMYSRNSNSVNSNSNSDGISLLLSSNRTEILICKYMLSECVKVKYNIGFMLFMLDVFPTPYSPSVH
jgi:hypothetical protein